MSQLHAPLRFLSCLFHSNSCRCLLLHLDRFLLHSHAAFGFSVMSRHYDFPFLALFRLEIAAAFFLASALLLAPHARSDSSKRVGLPSLNSGPLMLPMRARKLALRGLSPDFIGRFKFAPVVLLKKSLPFWFKPPFGF